MKFLEEWARRVAAGDALPYIFAALAIAPAAVVVAVYPVAHLLGAPHFFFNGLNITSLTWPLLAVFIAGFFASAWRREWIAALLVLPLVLLILPPKIGGPLAGDRLGAALMTPSPSSAFYPDSFDADHYRARLKQLQDHVAQAGWFYDFLPPLPSLDAAATRLNTAIAAVADYQSKKANTEQTLADLNAAKSQLSGELAQLRNNPYAWCADRHRNLRLNQFMGRGICMNLVFHRIAAVSPQLAETERQIAKAGSDPTASNAYGVALTSAAIAKSTLETYERWIAEKASFAQYLPYLFFASAGFITLLWRRGFQSSAMATLGLATIAGSIWAAWPLSIELGVMEWPRLLFPAFACVLSAVALRYIYRAFLDNRDIRGAFEAAQGPGAADRLRGARWVWTAFPRAAFLWVPFAGAVYSFVMIGNYVYDETSRLIYCQTELCQNIQARPIVDSDPRRDTLRDDLQEASQRLMAELEANALAAANSVEQSNAIQDMKNAAMVRISAMIRPNTWDWDSSLLPPGCKFWQNPKCYLFERKPLQALAGIYAGWRARLIARIDARLQNLATKFSNLGDEGAAKFREGIAGESETLARYSAKLIDSTFLYLAALTMIKYALLLMIVVRGFLLIFARTVYRADPDPEPKRKPKSESESEAKLEPKRKIKHPYMALTHTAPEFVAGSPSATIAITEYSELRVKLRVDETLLMKRRYDPDNAPPSVTLPMWRKWFWHRAANGCLFMNEIRKPDDGATVELTLSGNAQLIVWTIRKGQRVGFRWRDFVGMSKHAELDRSVSLRLGSLVLGHLMLPFVRCSGDKPVQLILRSTGAPDNTHGTLTSRSPRRLLSWSEATPFQIVASPKPVSVYFDDCHVEPHKEGWAVLDVGGDMGGSSTIFKEFLRLFRP